MQDDGLSFIAVYDNTEKCHATYVSDSVVDILGWEPSDLCGRPAFTLFDETEIPALHQVHLSNVMNEKLSSMISYKYLRKDGGFTKMQSIVHYCYQELVTTNWVYDEDSFAHKQRLNSASESFEITDDGELQLTSTGSFPWRPRDMQENMKRSLMVSTRWNKEQVTHQQEPRFYILLNRYTELLNIVRVSEIAGELLGGVRSNDLLGRSVFEVVHPKDRAVVEAQCTYVKSHHVTSRIRFDWIVNQDSSQPVDTVVSGSTDGLVMIIRLAQKPVQLS